MRVGHRDTPAVAAPIGARAFGCTPGWVRRKNPDAGEESVIDVKYDVSPGNERFSVEDGYLIERRDGETILRSAFWHEYSRRRGADDYYLFGSEENIFGGTVRVPDGVTALGPSFLFRTQSDFQNSVARYRLVLPDSLERISPEAVRGYEIGRLNIPARTSKIADDFWRSMVLVRKNKCRKEKDYAGNDIVVFKQDELEIEVDPDNDSVFIEEGLVCCLSSE